ncbi:MAG: asparagine--tRNA ligase [Deltaproteobacteria bacterium]|nr:asparagine--tRNA ligase [Deltaproteobacteria bacterium]
MNQVRIREIHTGRQPLGECRVSGWVRTHRQSKNVSFIELTDGSSMRGLQLVIDPSLSSYAAVAARISTGCALSVKGNLQQSPAKGQCFELHVQELQLVGEADPEKYPLQKKGHSLEFLRELLHLRPRSNTIGAVTRIRSAAAMAVHRFFQDRGFVYLHTPIITTADCEGAGEMFKVTTLDAANLPLVEGKPDYSQDFFGAEAGLTVSGQLEAESYACALSNVYTFGPTFRAENSNTTRHLAEFWMIEPEMAFCDLQGDMEVAQAFLVAIIKEILERCGEELEFLEQREWSDKKLVATLSSVVASRFEVMDYKEAVAVLEQSGRSFEFPVRWGMDLQAEHERYLTDEYVKGPLFVINYPKEIKAFYMRLNDDQQSVSAMDLLVPRLGEIIGGSQREERHDVLLQRMREMGLKEEDYWWYLDLRRYGTVPHAGFGLGFERFLMYVTDMHNIRDVIPFPRYPGYARF